MFPALKFKPSGLCIFIKSFLNSVLMLQSVLNGLPCFIFTYNLRDFKVILLDLFPEAPPWSGHGGRRSRQPSPQLLLGHPKVFAGWTEYIIPPDISKSTPGDTSQWSVPRRRTTVLGCLNHLNRVLLMWRSSSSNQSSSLYF